MLEPPPEPPRPGLSPPAGDIASELLPPLPGIATCEPGWDETTIPEPPAFPLSTLGGARAEPASPAAPRPEPLLPEPVPAPIAGGGGTMLVARSVALAELREFPVAPGLLWLSPAPVTDGGGGMTFDAPRDEPRTRVEAAPPADAAELPTDGGGGTTLVASELPGAPAGERAVPEETVG